MLALTIIMAGAGIAATVESRTTAAQLNLESFDYVWRTIRDKHFDPELGGLDWEAIREELRPKVEASASTEQAREVIREMTERLAQSHFGIFPAEVLEAMGGPVGEGFPGGVTGIDARVVEGRAIVTSVLKDSPADRAGIRPGWEILGFGGERIAPKLEAISAEFAERTDRGAVLAQAILSRLSGDIGETVSVQLREGGGSEASLDLELVETRGGLYNFGHIPNIHVWFDSRKIDREVGYIAFNAFLDPVRLMPAFGEAIMEFMDAPGIVIDLRGNGGGMLPMVMGMAGWLISDKGAYLGTMTLRDTKLKAIVNPRATVYRGPVAVLVDGLSASGAEVFSGGLQDLGRARVFGSRTMGAVLAGQIEKLPNGDGFMYVFANYVSASGRVLEGVGVVPDEPVAPSREALIQGRDAQLEAAVSWIRSQSDTSTVSNDKEEDR
jgi:carboxyl-terminal processing protease